ncbi:MAG: hypothetical protein JW895_10270 [Thermoleophilaceae bacterium]|nr:hypothetical protein [Thermoleophilaceae bacterium]
MVGSDSRTPERDAPRDKAEGKERFDAKLGIMMPGRLKKDDMAAHRRCGRGEGRRWR